MTIKGKPPRSGQQRQQCAPLHSRLQAQHERRCALHEADGEAQQDLPG